MFAGPPNYESIKRGDAKETAIILQLTRPRCTKGDDPIGVDVSYANIREMQLVVYSEDKIKNGELWKTVNRRMGKRVVITGTLFGAHTGHHRTNVLIQVADIRAPPETSVVKYPAARFVPIDNPNGQIGDITMGSQRWTRLFRRSGAVEHTGEDALNRQLPWIIQASLA